MRTAVSDHTQKPGLFVCYTRIDLINLMPVADLGPVAAKRSKTLNHVGIYVMLHFQWFNKD